MLNVVGTEYLRSFCGKTRRQSVKNEWMLSEHGLTIKGEDGLFIQ